MRTLAQQYSKSSVTNVGRTGLFCLLLFSNRVKQNIISLPFCTLLRAEEPDALDIGAISRSWLREGPLIALQIRGFSQREHYPRNHQREVSGTGRWLFEQWTKGQL